MQSTTMEFPFDINHLFSERISVLDQELVAGRKSIGRPDLQDQIATVIDELGKASAKAQQLPAPITTASKLQSNKHHLYLFKDGERNGGRGAAVGFLKVGYKKLFLLDQRGAHIEAEPLCILDFFICENLQRHGYGLELFEFMLQHKDLQPALMAYDRPSPKFLSFLAKHFCLAESVPQVNNFVVFDGFFLNRSVAQLRKAPPKKQDGEIKPYSLMERDVVRQEQRVRPWPFVRPAVPPPLSPQRTPSSQCSRSLSVGSSPSREPPQPQPQRPTMPSAPAPGGYTGQTPHSPLIDNCRARRTSQQGLAAGANLYSRHFNRRDVGFLLGRQERSTFTLPGLRPMLTDTGRQTHALGQTDRSPPLSLPPLCTSKKDSLCSQAPVVARETATCDTESCRSERFTTAQEQGSQSCSAGGVQVHHKAVAFKVERDGNNASGWSSTLGESGYTAHWVKQKQEYRSTRPW